MVSQAAFEIDDHKHVDDNMAAYIADLKSIDSALATVLAPYIGDCSRGKSLDNAVLLDALLAATAPAEGDPQ